MIELRDVTLTYPDGDGTITAINGAGLTVMPGQITAITGPSGSGKSSVLAVASTLIAPQKGSVLINGAPTAGLSRSETAALRRDEIGIVFQQANLLASLTALEQLELMSHLGSSANKRARSETRAKALELLAAVGLEKKANKRPNALSGGERQRVNIARAFMNDPSVLIVDEPTSALDQERGGAIIELIIELTRTSQRRHPARDPRPHSPAPDGRGAGHGRRRSERARRRSRRRIESGQRQSKRRRRGQRMPRRRRSRVPSLATRAVVRPVVPRRGSGRWSCGSPHPDQCPTRWLPSPTRAHRRAGAR